MCDCKKNTDGYCGCGHNQYDGLFGYKISATKKEKEAKDTSGVSEEKPKKKIDIAKAADQIKEGGNILDSLLSGFRKKPEDIPPPQTGADPIKERSNLGMWIGIGAAVVVIVIIWWFSTRKK